MAEDRKSQVIGRVAVDRTLRFRAAPQPSQAPSAPAALLCARCGRLLCEPGRVRLFAGMTLRCAGCGEGTRA